MDFRRIWLDKSTKEPTREGISLWRPVPPPGYFAVGGLPANAAMLSANSR